MANIVMKKSEFERYLPLTKENVERITMFGIPVELFGDEVMLEVFANRPDLLSVPRIVSELKNFFSKQPGLSSYKLNAPEKNYKVTVDASVKDVRPYTACAIVKGLDLDSSAIKQVIDLQEKLHSTFGRCRKKCAIGIYPMEKIALPITYKAIAAENIVFKPLEADKEMTGREILEKHPTGKEFAHLLDGMKKYPVFMDAKKQIMSMPPIINSELTGRITQDTRDVFVECSGFQYETVSQALAIIVTTLAEMGGKIYQMNLDYSGKTIKSPLLEPKVQKVNVENANRILGIKLEEKDLAKLLPKMGYDYKKGQATFPAWRTDILHEIDVIEDIAIAYGYDKIVPQIPNIPSIASPLPAKKLETAIAQILTGAALMETSSFHLIKEEETKRLGQKPIEVENSKTEYKHLRQGLAPCLLRIVADNKDNEYPQNIFEIGQIFRRNGSEIVEERNLAIALTPGQFTEGKRLVDSLFTQLGLSMNLQDIEHELLITGRTGSIMLNGERIGYLGEVHPETLKAWNIKLPVFLAELSIDKLAKQIKVH